MPQRSAPQTTRGRPEGTTQRTMDSLRRIVRALGASSRLPGRTGVSGAQLFVLRQIGDAPGLTIGELAARTLAGQSTVSEVVSRVVERGLVSRTPDADDARQTRLALTARGRATIRSTVPTAQERLAAALDRFTLEERVQLAARLEGWLDAAGLAELPPTMFFEDKGKRATARRTRAATRVRG